MPKTLLRRVGPLAFSILLLALAGFSPLLGQGCAMCRTSALAGGAKTLHALGLGILVLLVPPIGIVSTLAVMAVRREKSGHFK